MNSYLYYSITTNYNFQHANAIKYIIKYNQSVIIYYNSNLYTLYPVDSIYGNIDKKYFQEILSKKYTVINENTIHDATSTIKNILKTIYHNSIITLLFLLVLAIVYHIHMHNFIVYYFLICILLYIIYIINIYSYYNIVIRLIFIYTGLFIIFNNYLI